MLAESETAGWMVWMMMLMMMMVTVADDNADDPHWGRGGGHKACCSSSSSSSRATGAEARISGRTGGPQGRIDQTSCKE